MVSDSKKKKYKLDALNYIKDMKKTFEEQEDGIEVSYRFDKDINTYGFLPKQMSMLLNDTEESIYYLRLDTIGDGNCFYHSILQCTNLLNYTDSDLIKKKKICKDFKIYLSQSLTEQRYNNFCISKDKYPDIKSYKEHLKRNLEWGEVEDVPFVSSLINYNIFVLSWEDTNQSELQIINAFTFDINRPTIIIYNYDSMHFESVIRVCLDDDLINDGKFELDTENFIFNSNSEEIKKIADLYISNCDEMEYRLIRNWNYPSSDKIRDVCEVEGEYSKDNGYRKPNNLNECPEDAEYQINLNNNPFGDTCCSPDTSYKFTPEEILDNFDATENIDDNEYTENLEILNQLGFQDKELNLKYLKEFNNSIDKVIKTYNCINKLNELQIEKSEEMCLKNNGNIDKCINQYFTKDVSADKSEPNYSKPDNSRIDDSKQDNNQTNSKYQYNNINNSFIKNNYFNDIIQSQIIFFDEFADSIFDKKTSIKHSIYKEFIKDGTITQDNTILDNDNKKSCYLCEININNSDFIFIIGNPILIKNQKLLEILSDKELRSLYYEINSEYKRVAIVEVFKEDMQKFYKKYNIDSKTKTQINNANNSNFSKYPIIHADCIYKNNKPCKKKSCKKGKCIFPFNYKNEKDISYCIDFKDKSKGSWCTTSKTKTGSAATFGICK